MDENDMKRGAYPRYCVTKLSGKPVDPEAHYFVLRLDNGGSDPKHIAACRVAILAYANAIHEHIPHLAQDLFDEYDPDYNHKCWPDTDVPERLPEPDYTKPIELPDREQGTEDEHVHYAMELPDREHELDCDLGPACGVVKFENWTCEKRNVTCPSCLRWLEHNAD